VRLISIDRPGFGRSTPQPGCTLADGASDAVHLADALGYAAFGVSGWSDIDVTRIRRPVHVWQGADDRLVPPVISREVATRMPGAVLHDVPGGHFIAVTHAEQIFALAATELPR
jgi:pimeloyl-ACP methyl ester carboxylesterase